MLLEPKPCPFCGGNGHGKFKQQKFYSQNGYGDKKISYRVFIKCGRCHAEGPPVITEPLINPYPHMIFDSTRTPDRFFFDAKGATEENRRQWDMFKPYIDKAIDLWNRRENNAT